MVGRSGKDYKWAWGNFCGDEYVHYLNCGDGFMGRYMLKY